MNNIIEISNLTKTYNIKGCAPINAVNNINFSVSKGEFIAIKGVSGSGKSTLLNIIGTLDIPTSGDVKILGKDLSQMNQKELSTFRNEHIGFVLQDFALVPYNTGYENIETPLLFTKRKLNKRLVIENLAKQMKITKFYKQKVNTMSGGQKQRIAIARALINDPEIILADEPTGALDSSTKKDVIALLKEISNNGKTIIMVTHDETAAQIADRVINIVDGQLINN